MAADHRASRPGTGEPQLARGPARPWLSASAVFLAFFAIYNLNLRTIAAGDSWSTRFVPFALLRWGTVTLEGFREPILAGRASAYWLRELPDGRAASTYPIVTPLAVTALYLPAARSLEVRGWSASRLLPAARVMEKLAASALAACGVALLWGLLSRRAKPRDALWLTVAYGVGTGTWPISSQALWQHALAQLLVIVALRWSCAEPERSPRALGLVLGLLCANRLADLLLALGFLGAAAQRRPREALKLTSWAVAAGLPFLAYNLILFGSPIGGYAAFPDAPASLGLFQGVGAPLAMLASPGKGLLAFSPFLLLLLAPRGADAASGLSSPLARWLFAAIGVQILLFSFSDWDGGACYGPRFLLDALPILVVALVPVLSSGGQARRAIAATLLAFSVAIQYVGAFHYRGASNLALRVHRLGAVDRDPVWRLDLAPFLVEARQPRARFSLLEDLRLAFGPESPVPSDTAGKGE